MEISTVVPEVVSTVVVEGEKPRRGRVENLKRGNTVGVGRKPGDPAPSAVLSDFRHVYTRPEKEDDTEGRRNMRAYLREKPMEFMRQMVQLEIQHRNRSKKGVEAAAAQAVLVGPVVEGSKEARESLVEGDEGCVRLGSLLEQLEEEFHEQSVDVPLRGGSVDVPLPDVVRGEELGGGTRGG